MPTILLLLALQTQVTGSIAGVVRDTAGKPLPCAIVSIGGVTRHRGVDSHGEYRLDYIPAGRVVIVAWAYGYKTAQADTLVGGSGPVRVDFALQPLRDGPIPVGSVLGSVRDARGRLLGTSPMVMVTGYGYRRQSRADSLGQYRVDSILIGAVQVQARALGYNGVSVDTALTAPGQLLRIDFKLRPSTLKLFPVTSQR